MVPFFKGIGVDELVKQGKLEKIKNGPLYWYLPLILVFYNRPTLTTYMWFTGSTVLTSSLALEQVPVFNLLCLFKAHSMLYFQVVWCSGR